MTTLDGMNASNATLQYSVVLGISDDFPDPRASGSCGLVAVGGDLSSARLLKAYRRGVFPWYSEGEPIMWWSPDPRMVLRPERLHIPHGLRRAMKKTRFDITFDRDFAAVIRACRSVRLHGPKGIGTWITLEMVDAYERLHKLEHAHSVEVWQAGKLVGGLYGVVIGACFSGESMFSLVPDASKYGLVMLVERLRDWGFKMVDCQVPSRHLAQFGAELISREHFLAELECALLTPCSWKNATGACA